MQENSSDYYSHLLNTHHFAQADIKEDGSEASRGLSSQVFIFKMADKVMVAYERNIRTNLGETRKQDKKVKQKKNRKKAKKPVVEINVRKDRKVINEYHILNKKIDAIRKNPSISREDKASKIAALKAKKDKLGGINAYQQASRLGEAHHGSFNSAKWIVKQLKVLNLRLAQEEGTSDKLRLLDVGALDNNYQRHVKWIECTAIDLNPQSGNVKKADFLTLNVKEKYDVIVMSLVINFEGDVRKRGDMLRKCEKLINDQGYLFIVLPLPCLKNSRYLNKGHLISMMDSLGFEVCVTHNSKKLSFFIFKKTRKCQAKLFPKEVLRKGGNRNNFAIVL